jgi:hypothetical protein
MVGSEKCVHINNSFTPVTALNFKVKNNINFKLSTPSCTTTTTFKNGIYGLLGPLLTYANAAVYGMVSSPTNAQHLIKQASSLELWDVHVRAKLRDED